MKVKELKYGRYECLAKVLSFGYYDYTKVFVDIEKAQNDIQIDVLNDNKLVLDSELLNECYENEDELIINHDDCENTIIDKKSIKLIEEF